MDCGQKGRERSSRRSRFLQRSPRYVEPCSSERADAVALAGELPCPDCCEAQLLFHGRNSFIRVNSLGANDRDQVGVAWGSNPLITVAKAFQFGRAIWDGDKQVCGHREAPMRILLILGG